MNHSILSVLKYAALPAIAVLLGAAAASVRTPGERLRSVVQHFTSGLLFAVVGTELLPDVIHRRLPLATVIGFALGVAAMLALKSLSERHEKHAKSSTSNSLLWVLGVDIAMDGILIGVGFALGAKQGLLITLALTLEVLFLGVSATMSLSALGAGRKKVFGTATFLASLLLLGASIGSAISLGVSGAVLDAILAFTMAAILYLVTEELLVEAHEAHDTPFLTATFFAGFLVLPIIEMVS